MCLLWAFDLPANTLPTPFHNPSTCLPYPLYLPSITLPTPFHLPSVELKPSLFDQVLRPHPERHPPSTQYTGYLAQPSRAVPRRGSQGWVAASVNVMKRVIWGTAAGVGHCPITGREIGPSACPSRRASVSTACNRPVNSRSCREFGVQSSKSSVRATRDPEPGT